MPTDRVGLVERLLVMAPADGSSIVCANRTTREMNHDIRQAATTIAELVAAGIALRDDLEMRAELNKRRNGGEIVVEASAGVWIKFCAALTKVRSAL